MKISYKHIADCLNPRPDIKELSEKLFQLGHEHEIFDGIFDIEITPNRGDCLSLDGLLRDLRLFYEIQKNIMSIKKKYQLLILHLKTKLKNVAAIYPF